MPAVTVADLKDGDNFRDLRYMEGAPLTYRTDMRFGAAIVSVGEGEDPEQLTKKKEPFSFIPIAWRKFRAIMFGNEKEAVWVEAFFVNCSGAVCSIMLRNASADNFEKAVNACFYKNLEHFEAIFTMDYKEKTSKSGDKYHYAAFKAEPAPQELAQYIREATAESCIYRESTLVPCTMKRHSQNYPIAVMSSVLALAPGAIDTEAEVIETVTNAN